MRIVPAILLAAAFIVVDGVLLPLKIGGVGCGHFGPGSVVLPPAKPGDSPRTITYTVGFCEYFSEPPAIWPERWNISVGPDMLLDDEHGYTLDDCEAAVTLAAAQVYEKELHPRFGRAAEAVRSKFLKAGSAQIVQPAAIPLVGPLLLYGVPVLQLAAVAWVAGRPSRRKPPGQRPVDSIAPAP